MMKLIYLYINNQDLEELIKYIHENNYFLYNSDGEKTYNLVAQCNEFLTFYIGEEYQKIIEYQPCFYTSKYLQPALIKLNNCEDDKVIKLFNEIKKFIRKIYRISTDRSVYIGQHMYHDWENNKCNIPMLFSYREFKIDNSNFEEFINSLVHVGYKVKNNHVKVGNIDSLNYTEDSFVVFSRDEYMITTLFKKKILIYEYGSKCIWIYKIRKGKSTQVRVVLDERIAKDKESELYILFDKLKNKWEVKS